MTKPTARQLEALRLRDAGLKWREVGEKMGIQGRTASVLARCAAIRILGRHRGRPWLKAGADHAAASKILDLDELEAGRERQRIAKEAKSAAWLAAYKAAQLARPPPPKPSRWIIHHSPGAIAYQIGQTVPGTEIGQMWVVTEISGGCAIL